MKKTFICTIILALTAGLVWVYANNPEPVASGTFGQAGSTAHWTFDGETIRVFGGGAVSPGASDWGNNAFELSTEQIMAVTSIEIVGDIVVTGTMTAAFAHFSGLESVSGMERLNTAGVTGMQSTWRGTSVPVLDLSGWDTGNVTNMSNMFESAAITEKLNVSGWDTSRVTTMTNMFYWANMPDLLDLSDWDTAAVGGMVRMFNGAALGHLDLSGWDTRRATHWVDFLNPREIQSVTFGKNIVFVEAASWLMQGDWRNTETGVIHTSGELWMRMRISRTQDETWERHIVIPSWPFGEEGSTARWTFDHQTGAITISGGTAINPNSSNTFFASQGTAVTAINIAEEITVTGSMSGTFSGLPNLTAVNGLELLCTAGVTDMSGMFYAGHRGLALAELAVCGWDTGAVTDMSNMFRNVTSLAELDLSGWNTGAVTDMSGMFSHGGVYPGSSLARLNVSGWDTGAVTDMRDMFRGARSLTRLDLSGWDTSKVTDMGWIFSGANSLTEIDLSGWDTRAVEDMEVLFPRSTALNSITFGRYFVSVGSASLLPMFWQNTRSYELLETAWSWAFLHEPRQYDDTWVRVDQPEGNPFGLEASSARWTFDGTDTITITGGVAVRPHSGEAFRGISWETRDAVSTINIAGDIRATYTMAGTFSGFPNLTAINGLERIDTTAVDEMQVMFNNSTSLRELDLTA